MRETLERERKLAVGPDFKLPPLPVEPTPRHLQATYYDTADHRLARHGVTLRRRLEDGRDLWQLKLPAGGDRLELEREASGPEIPTEFVQLIKAYVRGRDLRPLAELHTLRRAVRVMAGGRPAAEVVHDTVQVRDGGHVTRTFSEVEIEQIADGAERLIARLERQLRAAGARASDGRPKVFQALGLPSPRDRRPRRRAPAIEHLRAYLEVQVDALLAGDPVTRRGDSEGVHGMRVATRRMRSALKEAQRLLDRSWVDETRGELKWLGTALGDVRDADVLAEYVARETGELDAESRRGGTELTRLINERSGPARSRLSEVLDSQRYLTLLDRLESIHTALPVAPGGESLERILRRAARRALRALRGITASSSDQDLHRVRIASKRARYAAELTQRALGRPARRLAGRAAALQELLGEHQDAVVAEERLQAIGAEASPAAALVAGRLVERQRRRRDEARAALPRAAKRFVAAAERL
jgi:CHAD domain-containing protein